MTDPRWEDPRTVDAIAAGPDWAAKVAAFEAAVDMRAHDQAHVQPIPGCPGCPQAADCRHCGWPLPVCPNPEGHYRVWRGSETSLLVGTAVYGGAR